ncbi:F-box domain [Macleaya cordata]|uniref:F-box domain n=1 Tax=Macleaya cordata TaxID=56857 RepID=A0A200QZT1_MACCD|nr:F-box domain [Macleaya cordata]
MAEWSQLPRELLDSIAKLLTSDIYVLRFRSVCSSWRSSVSYPLFYQLPNCIPIHPKVVTTSLSDLGVFYLSKRVILRLGLPENQQRRNFGTSWLIKLEQDVPGMLRLLNPLTENPIYPLPTTFPKIFDTINFQISELGQEYVLRYTNKPPFTNQFGYSGDVYMEKVVFSSTPPWSVGIDYVIMTIHVSGKLAVFRSIDNSWTVIDDFTSPYDDVICYKGGFYAVDTTGRAVVVSPSLTVTEIASPVFGGEKKCLVESEGELLLVDRYLSIGPDEDLGNVHDDEHIGQNDTYIVDSTIWFKVYKLNQGGQNWVELKSLGDRVLFLGDNCSFSTSASDFTGCKGSCIYFTDMFVSLNKEEDDAFKACDIGVFNLEDGSIGPLMSYQDRSQLFWPPPAWISTVSF